MASKVGDVLIDRAGLAVCAATQTEQVDASAWLG